MAASVEYSPMMNSSCSLCRCLMAVLLLMWLAANQRMSSLSLVSSHQPVYLNPMIRVTIVSPIPSVNPLNDQFAATFFAFQGVNRLSNRAPWQLNHVVPSHSIVHVSHYHMYRMPMPFVLPNSTSFHVQWKRLSPNVRHAHVIAVRSLASATISSLRSFHRSYLAVPEHLATVSVSVTLEIPTFLQKYNTGHKHTTN